MRESCRIENLVNNAPNSWLARPSSVPVAVNGLNDQWLSRGLHMLGVAQTAENDWEIMDILRPRDWVDKI